ncbi:MAG TPA: hypothetical protein VFZ73_12070 [Gemmatimonadaceae bacterium]
MSQFVRRTRAHRSRVLLALAVVLGAALSVPAHAPAVVQATVPAPDSLTDAEFWDFFRSMSEPDGYFLSENFVSNELSFQHVIPTLQRTLTENGVYLGVGPEQNFTYIANLKPRMAVIFDIRRQNALQHLMYKALFELSPTRVEFVSRLFSRPAVARLDATIDAKALFDSALAAPADDSAYSANLTAIVTHLTGTHGFALPMEDIASISHVYKVFFTAGPDVNYGYRPGNPTFVRSTYPTFGMLQAATNADSVPMAFLASEEHYRAVRQLQLRNLIVPVVGDFGGPSAIRSVAQWLRERQMTVTAFYVSNVEQYLFRDLAGASDRFYMNVSSLPLDSTSQFIRSVPGMGSMSSFSTSRGWSVPGTIRFTVSRDALGRTTSQIFRDSAGVTVVQTTRDTVVRDSASIRAVAAQDSAFQKALRDLAGNDTALASGLKAMRDRRDSLAQSGGWQIISGPPTMVRVGGLLASGIASMTETVRTFFTGELTTYNAVVERTRVTGWR